MIMAYCNSDGAVSEDMEVHEVEESCMYEVA